MNAFDSVFGNGPSPSGFILVQRQVEEDDRQSSRFSLDFAEIGQVNDTRPAPTRPEIEQNHLAFELTQRYGLTVEVVEGKVGRRLPRLQLQGLIYNCLDGLVVFRGGLICWKSSHLRWANAKASLPRLKPLVTSSAKNQ